jgi:hypothetical protein
MDSLKKLNYSQEKINKILRRMNGGNPIDAQRMFVGKNRKHQVGLFIQDQNGNNRIEIYVNKQNKVQMKFFDENGNALPFDSLK